MRSPFAVPSAGPAVAVRTLATASATRTPAWRRLLRPSNAGLIAAFLLAAVPALDALSDPDVWWHLRTGRWIADNHSVLGREIFTYTASGVSWTPHEWLAELAYAGLFAAGGLFLLSLVMGAVTLSALGACAVRARDRGASPAVVAVAVLLGAKAAQPVLGTRVQVITVALVAWTLLLAERHLARGGRQVWLIPPLVVVWANLHSGFVAGLALLTLLVLVEALRARLRLPGAAPGRRVARLAVVVGLAAAAGCATPAGPGIYTYFAYFATSGRFMHDIGIAEWQRPDLLSAEMLTVDLLVISLPLLLRLGGRIELRDGVLGAAALVAFLVAVRNLSLLVAVGLPAWASAAQGASAALSRALHRRPRPATRPTLALGVPLLAAGVVGLGIGIARLSADASDAGVAAHYPACAAGVVARSPQPVRLFAPYFFGGYLIDRLWPGATVFAYGDRDPGARSVFDGYFRIAGGAPDAPSALQLLDSTTTNAVLTHEGALSHTLDGSAAWRYVTSDIGLRLYVRGDPDWAREASC